VKTAGFEYRSTRRQVLKAGGVGSLALYLGACGASGGSGKRSTTLNWLTWGGAYLHNDPNQLADVRKATGINARPQLISDNTEVYLKLRTSPDQVDIATGDALWLTKFGKEDLITSFDLADIGASKQLYPAARSIDFFADGSKTWAYPQNWSTVPIYYNPKHVSPAPTSWDVFTDPKYRKRIVMENQPSAVMAYGACATGAKDPFNMTPQELSRAKEWLKAVKPNILTLAGQGEEIVRALTSEQAWLASADLGFDVLVKDAGGPEIKVAEPSEGTVGWVGGIVIGRKADPDAVLQWLNAMEQGRYPAQNFLVNGAPWFNERSYKILVDQGKKERADRFYFNEPERAFKATLKGPSKDPQAVVDAFNEVIGA
jgi:spermidine/putrescine-binding protein